MKLRPNLFHRARRAYTLIEALVASSILCLGVGAAASMSLSMVSMEEQNESTVVAAQYFENAIALVQYGIAPAQIDQILPKPPHVQSLAFTNVNINTTGFASSSSLTRVTARRATMVYKPTRSVAFSTPDNWTGGDEETTRTVTSVFLVEMPTTAVSTKPRAIHGGTSGL